MKSRSTILVGILLCLSLFVVGNLGSPALATDETPLEDAMSGIKSKLRKVKRALRAEDVTAALEGMQALEEAALAAKKFEPKMVMEEKDEAKKAALMKDFRLRVIAHRGDLPVPRGAWGPFDPAPPSAGGNVAERN